MATSGPVMIAVYQVEEGSFDGFLALLEETEAVYRKHAVLSAAPVLRLRSTQDPSYVMEILSWADPEALGRVMENPEIQAKWSEIKAAWKRGDFPWNEVPEASEPWAVLQAVP